METRLFDFDPVFGVRRWFHYDHATDQFTIETEQDISLMREVNTARFNDAPSDWRGDMHLVASIPLNIYMELKEKGIADDQEALRRWLNDRDNRVFRVRPGVV